MNESRRLGSYNMRRTYGTRKMFGTALPRVKTRGYKICRAEGSYIGNI